MSRYVMASDTVVELLAALGDHGVDGCVGGGWAVDALLGEQTRSHSDLDLWLPAEHLEPLFVALTAHGIDRVLPWPGDRPWNFVLHDGSGAGSTCTSTNVSPARACTTGRSPSRSCSRPRRWPRPAPSPGPCTV